MYNFDLTTADRRTHVKIVVVALIAGIVVVVIGKAARTDLPNLDTRMVRPPALMADKPVVWTRADRVTIR